MRTRNPPAWKLTFKLNIPSVLETVQKIYYLFLILAQVCINKVYIKIFYCLLLPFYFDAHNN